MKRGIARRCVKGELKKKTEMDTTIVNDHIKKDVGRDLNVAKNYSNDKTIMFGLRELVANWFY